MQEEIEVNWKSFSLGMGIEIVETNAKNFMTIKHSASARTLLAKDALSL